MVEISGYALWLWAVLLLVVPLKWMFAAFSAAVFHELCHIFAVWLCGGRVMYVKIGAFGASIQIHGITLWEELICTLAGVSGSFLLTLVSRQYPLVAVCGLMQGFYNLMPLYPLDGGRALQCFLQLTMQKRSKWVRMLIQNLVLIVWVMGMARILWVTS